jgi:tetratricopeptide (TPR) repeat protein/energy-coupling factor transporter ATP-binding protein EcfA2
MRADAFDVFLSYSRWDWRPATDIECLLRGASLRPFFDRRELTPGLPWVRALEQAIGKSGAAIILIGPRGFGNTRQYERELAFYRQTREPDFRIIPVLLPGTIDPPAGFLQLLTWIDFSGVSKVAEAPDQIARLLEAIQGASRRGDSGQKDLCPYRGLDAFREEDSLFYFARGNADDKSTPLGELVEKARGNSFVMVVGRSGSGKSSLVFAGLLPELRRDLDLFWHVLSFRPGADPLRTLAEAFNVRGENEGMASYASKITEETTRLREGDLKLLGHVIREYLEQIEGKPDRLLLYVDQWEELYAQAAAAGSDERVTQQRRDVDRFIDLLLNATQSAPVTVVATVRADFYDSLVRHPQLRSVLPAQQVNLTAIPREQLRLSITEPAKMVGLTFDPSSLVDRILDEAGEDEGMLPLLQYALKETWACRSGNIMTADSYERSGGVQRAIRTTAERNFERLSSEDQIAARQLFLRLVTPGEGQEDTRARAAMPTASDLQKIVQNFAGPKTRLLVTGRDRAGPATVEVAHEALIRTWPRLREWVDANREMLRARAAVLQAQADWEQNSRRDDLLLPTGFQLERARALLDNPGDITIDDIQDYISQSLAREKARIEKEKEEELEDARQAVAKDRAACEAAEQARKKLKRQLVFAFALILIAIGSLIIASISRFAAENARIEAERQRDNATTSLKLARSTADDLVVILAGDLRNALGIRLPTLSKILGNARKTFDKLAGTLRDDPVFQTSYANMMTQFGRTYLDAGDLVRAQQSFEEALKIHQAAMARGGDKIASLRGVAEQTDQIAKVLQQSGKLDKAAENIERALNLRTEILSRSDGDPLSYRDVGLSLYHLGHLVKLMNGDSRQAVEIQETARVMILTAQSLRGDKPELDLTTSLIYGSLGDAYQALGNVVKWQESLVLSLNLLENLIVIYPDNSEYARYLGWAHQYLGDFYLGQKNWPAALEQYEACLSVREKLARDDPSKGIYQYDLAWAHHLLGNFYFTPGGADLDRASQYYEMAYKLRNQLVQADSTNKRWQKDFALSLESLGDVANRKADREGALANYEKARSILQKLVEDDPRNGGWVSLLSALQKVISRVETATTGTLSVRE